MTVFDGQQPAFHTQGRSGIVTLSIFTLKPVMFNLLITTETPGILHVSSRYQWFSLFMHKTLVLLLFPLHKLGKWINSQWAPLNWMQNYCWLQWGVSLENVFSSFFLPHRSAAKWLRVKIMRAFHVKELELMVQIT